MLRLVEPQKKEPHEGVYLPYGRVPNFIEADNFTVYMQAPIGVTEISNYLTEQKIHHVTGYMRPIMWKNVTMKYSGSHYHIHILRHPTDRHIHSSMIHKSYSLEVYAKRVADFYRFYLHPYLELIEGGDFYYIEYNKLSDYIHRANDDGGDGGVLFDLQHEIDAWQSIKNNRTELTVENFNRIIRRDI